MTTQKTERTIRKDSVYCRTQIVDLLQSLFVAECIAPSERIWLASAWVSDIAVLDNTGLRFSGITSRWESRKIRLTEVLVELALRGSEIIVITNQDEHNEAFKQRLKSAGELHGVGQKIRIRHIAEHHTKALLGDNFYLDGSMNFTRNGIEINGETIRLELASDRIAQARLEFNNLFNSARS